MGKAQRKVVGEFKQRLARLIDKNETLPELEKMERSEFVVDVAGRYRILARLLLASDFVIMEAQAAIVFTGVGRFRATLKQSIVVFRQSCNGGTATNQPHRSIN